MDKVLLVPKGRKGDESGKVLVIDAISATQRPVIDWVSDRTLQIKVPVNSLIGLQKSMEGDVTVSVKFDPDDPAERERFLSALRERMRSVKEKVDHPK